MNNQSECEKTERDVGDEHHAVANESALVRDDVPQQHHDRSKVSLVQAECRKPIKKRRVDVEPMDITKHPISEAIPKPSRLHRQVASYWKPRQRHSVGNQGSKKQDEKRLLQPEFGPYNYDECYGPEEETIEELDIGKKVRDKSIFHLHCVAVSTAGAKRSKRSYQEYCEGQACPVSIKSDPSCDVDAELVGLTRDMNGWETGRPSHAVTPSPILLGNPTTRGSSNSQGGATGFEEYHDQKHHQVHTFIQEMGLTASDFEPIPWSEETQDKRESTSVRTSPTESILAFEDEMKEVAESLATPTPIKAFKTPKTVKTKQVRFDIAANTLIAITPRQPKKPTHPRQTVSHQAQLAKPRHKTVIEQVMPHSTFFSPIRQVHIGQSSSAFSLQRPRKLYSEASNQNPDPLNSTKRSHLELHEAEIDGKAPDAQSEGNEHKKAKSLS